MLKLLSNQTQNENDLLSLSLDEIARVGAKRLLAQALDLEVTEYITRHQTVRSEDGKRLVVRNGKSKARKSDVFQCVPQYLAGFESQNPAR